MNVESLVCEQLTLEVTEPPDKADIVVDWLGKANHRKPTQALMPFFEGLVEVAADKHKNIEFHFENLEHFNSSTIVVLMKLLKKLEEKDLRLVVFYDSSLKWQKMTFDALRQFQGPGKSLEIRTPN